MSELDPTLVDRAQARFAEILSSLADKLSEGLRALVADSDMAGVATLLAATESAAADLTAAHMEILTGVPSPIDLTPRSMAADLVERIAADPDQFEEFASDFVHRVSGVEAQRFAEFDETPDIRFWVRVTSPGDTCGLCVQAATRVYKRADLAPIHARCRCTVRPLLTDVTAHKRSALALADEVDAELAKQSKRNGRPRTAKQSRSRSKNVRVTTPEPPV